jgi:hypothetical protein
MSQIAGSINSGAARTSTTPCGSEDETQMVWTHQTNMVLEGEAAAPVRCVRSQQLTVVHMRVAKRGWDKGLELIFVVLQTSWKFYTNNHCGACTA